MPSLPATLGFGSFPPHMRLLLGCAGARPADPASLRALHTLGTDPAVDWPALLAAAHVHRVSPLVAARLYAAAVPVPPEAAAPLRRRTLRNALAAARAAEELARIDRRLTAEGFAPIVLKGIALSATLYDDPAARHVGDLDLLTTPDRLDEQERLLAELGYHRVNPPGTLSAGRRQLFARFWKDFTFESESAGFDLDLHWRLFNHRGHPGNALLPAPPATFTVRGHTLRCLPAADQFLHAAAHGVADLFTHLKSLADIAAGLATLSPAALAEAETRARRLGLQPQLEAATTLAALWIPPRPDLAAAAPQPQPQPQPQPGPLARHIHTRVSELLAAQNFLPSRDFPSPAEWQRLEARLVPGPAATLERLRRYLGRPRVWSAVDLPDTLLWLYPLLGLLLPPRRHAAPAARQPGSPAETAPRKPQQG